MTDQELLAYEREHHDDPDMTLEKATETQRLALHCWASGAATRRRTGLPSRRRDVAYIRRCFRATPLSLSQKGGRDWKSATTTAGSPDPLTKLAATRDPTAQMGFPRLLPDRTRQIADGIGSARRGEQLSP
jgi:hypothetical protein